MAWLRSPGSEARTGHYARRRRLWCGEVRGAGGKVDHQGAPLCRSLAIVGPTWAKLGQHRQGHGRSREAFGRPTHHCTQPVCAIPRGPIGSRPDLPPCQERVTRSHLRPPGRNCSGQPPLPRCRRCHCGLLLICPSRRAGLVWAGLGVAVFAPLPHARRCRRSSRAGATRRPRPSPTISAQGRRGEASLCISAPGRVFPALTFHSSGSLVFLSLSLSLLYVSSDLSVRVYIKSPFARSSVLSVCLIVSADVLSSLFRVP